MHLIQTSISQFRPLEDSSYVATIDLMLKQHIRTGSHIW